MHIFNSLVHVNVNYYNIFCTTYIRSICIHIHNFTYFNNTRAHKNNLTIFMQRIFLLTIFIMAMAMAMENVQNMNTFLNSNATSQIHSRTPSAYCVYCCRFSVILSSTLFLPSSTTTQSSWHHDHNH